LGDAGEPARVADRAITKWKKNGFEPLRIMAALLEMPSTTVRNGDELIYVWPGIFDWTPEQLAHIDESEWRSALETIYPDIDRQAQSWIDFGSYLGWRIGIGEDGHWWFFVAGD
jgi:hypothetical protein